MSSSRSFSDLPMDKPIQSHRKRFATVRATFALVMREMSTTYGRSPGGYIWAILEPVGGIAVLSAVFSTGFRNPSLGTNFAFFYATGFLPFYMFLMTATAVTNSIIFSRQLLSYPGVTFMDAIFARFLLHFLTQLMVSYFVFTGLLLFFETRTVLIIDQIVLTYALAALFGLGFGSLNCFLASMFPVWRQIWSMFSRPLVLVSGVIFLHDLIPNPYQAWMEWNPLVHIVGISRTAFYPYYQANYASVSYVVLVSLICMVFGFIFLRRYKYDILNY